MDQYWQNQFLVLQAALRKIEENMPEFDSTSLRDYREWESIIEQYIYEFSHSSRQVGAIIEKKLIGYVGACWHIKEMRRENDVLWRYIKRGLRIFLNKVVKNRKKHDIENQVSDAGDAGDDEKKTMVDNCDVTAGEEVDVVVKDTHVPIIEESIDDVGDCSVMELEVENPKIVVDIEEVDGKFELQEVENPETVVIDFDLREVQVVDELDPIVGQIEIQVPNNRHWSCNDFIDRSHDEWYETIGK